MPRFDEWDFENLGNETNIDNVYTPYIFNAPDIGNEYHALNNFLNTNLLDDSSLFPGDGTGYPESEQPVSGSIGDVGVGNPDDVTGVRPIGPSESSNSNLRIRGMSISRPKSTRPMEKEDEKFYLNIADPSGNDKPEERMKRLLEAKFKAGLLRPFNYIQGYARLNTYLEGHMRPALRQRMMRHIEKFRPKFREKMQSMTDMELTMVEMWFERTLMEYDRVFATMAVPACCWRRTGEIFRGNKAMAELIQVPVDQLREVRMIMPLPSSLLTLQGPTSTSRNHG